MGSNNSLIEEDDGSYSEDQGSSSHEDEFGSREDVEECLEEKIKWFFLACEEEKQDSPLEDHLNQSITIEAPTQGPYSSEQNFSTIPIDSDSLFTNDHSTLVNEPSLLGKRKSDMGLDSTSESSYKRQKISENN
jgi:hypothetical protein